MEQLHHFRASDLAVLESDVALEAKKASLPSDLPLSSPLGSLRRWASHGVLAAAQALVLKGHYLKNAISLASSVI